MIVYWRQCQKYCVRYYMNPFQNYKKKCHTNKILCSIVFVMQTVKTTKSQKCSHCMCMLSTRYVCECVMMWSIQQQKKGNNCVAVVSSVRKNGLFALLLLNCCYKWSVFFLFCWLSANTEIGFINTTTTFSTPTQMLCKQVPSQSKVETKDRCRAKDTEIGEGRTEERKNKFK